MEVLLSPRFSRYQAELLKVKFRCKACGADLTKIPFHLDHIYPKSKGGSEESWNFQILCANCNMSKGAKTMEQWAPWLLKEDSNPINSWEDIGWIEVPKKLDTPYNTVLVHSRQRRRSRTGQRKSFVLVRETL